MKQNRVISTAVLFLLLGTTAFVYAQKGPKEKAGGGQKAQQAQRSQHAQQAQRSQHTQQVQPRGKQQRQRVAYNRGNNGNHYGRIPDDRFRANFGRGHSFRMIRPRMIAGYQRFQYNGYWFGYNDPWPSGWYYTDDVYVDFVGGAYYMYNPRHPGIHIRLNLF